MTTDNAKNSWRPETLAAQALHYSDPETAGIVPPIQPSTTYGVDEAHIPLGPTQYTRYHNPTFTLPERLLAELEGGEEALLFASGLAASAAAFQALAPGEHVVVQLVIYWGLRGWLEDFCPRWGIELDLADLTDPEELRATIRKDQTKLVWIETPSNPLWEVLDIAALAEICREAGALLAVDSTAATPVLSRPLELGADLVMHSATKFLNGHSDVLAGALVTKRKDAFWARVLENRSKVGAVLGPFEAWLLLRGLRTLYVRVERQSASAQRIAEHFEAHPKVSRVRYPGLPSHPGHELAKRQMRGGFGGMLSIEIAGGRQAALAVAGHCALWVRATSLGGVESLIEHRATIEGPNSPCPDNLLRLSVGLEAPDDLIADLERALDQAG
ncbi:MAG: PLP-dependent aspartate aminotransferase family protein [Rhodovibrionaceae bacterium]